MAIDNIKVSVCMTAYNVEKYIALAIDSVIAQQTNFKFEILIGEDCSTDNTKAIIEDYCRRYPELIRVWYFEKNGGYSANLCHLVNNTRGEYYAQIDTDDIIVDTGKLQKMVDFLDSHPDHAVCIHNFKIIDSEGRVTIPAEFETPPNVTRTFFWNSTVAGDMGMIRRSTLPVKLYDWVSKSANACDWAIYMIATMSGDIGYIHDIMMAYRKHTTNITVLAKKDFIYDRGRFIWENLRPVYKAKFGNEYEKRFKSGLAYYSYLIAYTNLAKGNVFSFLRHMATGMLLRPELKPSQHKNYLYTVSPETFYRFKKVFGG